MDSAGQLVIVSIAGAKVADEELTAIVRQYARFVYRVAYSVLRDHHDAEDAAQETFIRVMKNHKRLSEIRDLRCWLGQIAWRVALRRRSRTLKRSQTSLENLGQPCFETVTAVEPERLAQNQQMLLLLDRLIASLPKELRDVLILSTIEDMSARDLADILAIAESTVRTRLHRARALLRQKLATLMRRNSHAE